jgi:hypothetical protein
MWESKRVLLIWFGPQVLFYLGPAADFASEAAFSVTGFQNPTGYCILDRRMVNNNR